MVLILKNLLFTVLVPGTVAVYVPFLLTGEQSPAVDLASLPGLLLIALGGRVYLPNMHLFG